MSARVQWHFLFQFQDGGVAGDERWKGRAYMADIFAKLNLKDQQGIAALNP